MLKSKSYLKINRGGYQKVVKEHYLRDDIPCGILGCAKCTPAEGAVLLDPQPGKSILVPQAHVLLPDTNILLHHLDALESFTDVVILQTVLEEVRSRNSAIYTKVRSMASVPGKRFFVFSNEHHRDTYIDKSDAGESDNDRNDRAIRKAVAWYTTHTDRCVTVLLTNDRENGRRAREDDGLPHVYNLLQYLRGCPGSERLVDAAESAMAAADASLGAEGDAFEYCEHMPQQTIQEGLSSGRLLQGTLRTSPYNTMEGTVAIDQPGAMHASVAVHGRMHLSRAINGDVVAVEVFPRDQWTAANKDRVADQEQDDEGGIIGEQEARPDATSSVRPTGRIVGIVRRKSKPLCGSIDRRTIREQVALQSVLFVPMDKHYPRIRFQTRQADALRNQRIIVQVDGWPVHSKYPVGHYVRTLGEAGDRATETEAILLEHDVNHEEFTAQVMACLPSADWDLAEADLREREDFRSLCICSVDPPGCTDIDDALHARELPSGNIEVGVHIADVTHFVAAGTPLDREAAARATTVYLVDRRIDMLPGLLGTNLCSLRSNVNRLAFSCVWEVRPEDASIVSTRFTKSVIKSRASLTYDQAQERLDAPESKGDDDVTRGLRRLSALAKILKARRIAAGSLTLASPEFRFNLDTETQNPVDVEMKEMRDANSMVEEFMLLANCSVARRIHEAYPDSALLRRHPNPPVENFEAINAALEPYGVELNPRTSLELAATLDAAVIEDDHYFNRLIRIMTTRCMLQAVYFSAGSVTEDAFWHYGLATPIYTHFTSPIRRYADVVVHRQLAACLGAQTTHFRDRRDAAVDAESFEVIRSKQRVEDLASNINYRHRMAQYAQRSSVELFTHLYFRGKRGIREPAYVIRVMQNGFVVLLPKYGIEGLIHVDEQGAAKFDASQNAFVGGAGEVLIRLFQRVLVEINVEDVEASQKQKLVVALLEPAINASSASKKMKSSP